MLLIKWRNRKETQEHLRVINIAMTKEMPLRTLASFSMGKVTIEQMEAWILIFNNHIFKGLWRMRKARKRKKELNFI